MKHVTPVFKLKLLHDVDTHGKQVIVCARQDTSAEICHEYFISFRSQRSAKRASVRAFK
jgi:hypothetical protein